MSDGITIQLRGGVEVSRALDEMRDELPKNVVRSALRVAAQRMLRVVAAFAPRRTLRLISALALKTSSRNGFASAKVTINTAGKRGDPENAYYWRFLEKGWHDRAGVPHRMQFVEPAFETEAADAAQSVINAVGTAIDRVAARHGAV